MSTPTQPLSVAALVVVLGLASLIPAAPAVAASHLQAPPAPHLQAPPALPRAAVAVGSLAPGRPMTLSVLLAPRDPAGLAALADAVPRPGSGRYHRYMSEAGFAGRFGALPSTVDAVARELGSKGLRIGAIAANGLSLSVSGSAGAVEHAFGVHLAQERIGSRLAYANAGAAILPAGSSAVLGLDDLVRTAPAPRVDRPRAGSAPSCPTAGGATYVPAQIAQAYGADSLYGQGLSGAGQTVATFELADYSDQDIGAYAACFGGSDANVSRVPIDGGAPIGSGTSESAADIDNLLGMAPAVQVLVYEAPGTAEGIYDNYAAMVSQNRAQVLTTSYGQCEVEMSPGEAQGENYLFQEAAVQGQTVLAAAGDSGSEDCYVQGVDNNQSLAVDDPASQPYVTGVGGTSLTSTSPRSETAWNAAGGAGGGGISRDWAMPAYQRPVINSRSSGAPCGASPGPCREVPDVSASSDPAHGYYFFCQAGDCAGAGWQPIGGTSLASPLWAALIALSNQACPAGPAGFLNPALYRNPSTATNDITTGTNDLLGRYGLYPAGPGYDLASGLGSPDAAGLATDLCAATSTSTAARSAPGYRLVASDGGIFDYGAATYQGSTGAIALNRPIVGMASTPDGQGYWLVASDGGIFTFGDAGFYGSTGAIRLNRPIVGMAATTDGRGYWLVASDGGIFAFGDAPFQGSASGSGLRSAVVGMAADPQTSGYWIVTAAGGVLAYGAPNLGSAPFVTRPIVGMAASPDGAGYRLTGSDGNIYALGDATSLGSLAGSRLSQPVVGISDTADGFGYWLVAADGGIFSYGDARFLGSAGALRLTRPVVGLSTSS